MNKILKSSGILSSQEILDLIKNNIINSDQEIDKDIIQPASIDLRLGQKAWRVPASFLPGKGNKVSTRLKGLAMHEFSLVDGAVLECGCVYIVKLLENVSLTSDLIGLANPKSSTGRLDLFTRLIVDEAQEFEQVPAGYEGPLYIEISPRTFSVIVRTGSRLNQLRLRRGNLHTSDKEMEILQAHVGLVRNKDNSDLPDKIKNGVPLSVDLSGENGLIGFKARKYSMLIDVDKPNFYKSDLFWEKITTEDLLYSKHDSNNKSGALILIPDAFYILASKEYVSVPSNYAAEMRAYDTKVGEFRAHYAGFFDPGFGLSELGASKTKAVLEVRSHDVPFLIEQEQTVCRLVYEPMASIPKNLYGEAGGTSNYQSQGLKLAKHFI
ncbi:2'-deoxycytidine 5'-triphosphate deaminase [Alphaproteobacteria bacterium]|nr:2'-deoxycytidine 5'-triphosphate deaminase [Alphaproteobacteria bacterium]|tara:strand:- start:11993 stop:13135 length:1143 start_codon:yes stop_codon:yes gene_type:complete